MIESYVIDFYGKICTPADITYSTSQRQLPACLKFSQRHLSYGSRFLVKILASLFLIQPVTVGLPNLLLVG